MAAEKKSKLGKINERGGAEDKAKALDIALANIEKQFGKGAIMKLGEKTRQMDVSVIPSGCLELDVAMGTLGMPRGRIIDI